jgi:Flp pilus assembly protein CpaB
MTNSRMLLVGLAVAAVAALLVGLLQSLSSPDQAARGAGARQHIVAARDLPAGRKLVAQDLAWANAPEGVDAGLASSSEALGRALVVPLSKGQPLREANLTTRLSGAAIANLLPSGQRAITISLRDTSPEVVLYPGAMVDVLATFEVPGRSGPEREALTRTVLEAAKVLAVNEDAVGAADGAERRSASRRLAVTLAVTAQQAADLELASSRATLGIALRSEQDRAAAQQPVSPVATTASVFGAEWLRSPAAEKVEPRVVEQPAPPQPAPVVAPQPAPEAPKKAAWEVKVLGGDRTERTEFPAKDQ